MGVSALGLGEIYVYLAEHSRSGRAARIDLWRQARESLQRGMASVDKVRAHAKLAYYDMVPVRDGEAALARARARRSPDGTQG